MDKILRSPPVTGTRRIVKPDPQKDQPTRQQPQASQEVSADLDNERPIVQDSTAEELLLDLEATELSAPALFNENVALKAELEALQEKYRALDDQVALAEQAAKSEKEEAKRVQEEQKEKGYEAGFRKGFDEATERMAEKAQELDAVLASLKEVSEIPFNGLQDLMGEISMAALCKLLGVAFSSAEGVAAAVEQVLDQVRDATEVNVLLSQRDYDLLTIVASDFESRFKARGVTCKVDPRVSVGGCMVESAAGTWDGRLETQLQKLKDSLDAVSVRMLQEQQAPLTQASLSDES